MDKLGLALAVLGAALAAFGGGAGSAKGVGIVGEAASGLVAADPSKFTKALILQILPGTQGLYGFITAIVVMIQTGIFTGDIASLTVADGISYLVACLPIAVVGYFSAISQGRVAASGISVISKKPEEQSKAMVLAAMVETYAVLALLVSLLLIFSL